MALEAEHLDRVAPEGPSADIWRLRLSLVRLDHGLQNLLVPAFQLCWRRNWENQLIHQQVCGETRTGSQNPETITDLQEIC